MSQVDKNNKNNNNSGEDSFFSKENMTNMGIGFGLAGLGALAGNNNNVAGNAFKTVGGVVSAIPGGQLYGAALQGIGHITNALFGYNLNQQAINNAESNINRIGNTKADLSSTDSLISQFNNFKGIGSYKKDDFGTEGLLSNKVTNLTADLNNKRIQANSRAENTMLNGLEAIKYRDTNISRANFRANGGPLTMRYEGVLSPFGYRFDTGGNMNNDMKGNKHTNGTVWDTDLQKVNNGNSHEVNPLGGVPMGMAPDGLPNLVEEGETIWNDYVFSDRLSVPKKLKDKYKLGKDKISFAEATEKINKEKEERPNDPITKRGIDSKMSEFQEAQEEIKFKQQMRRLKNAINKMSPEELGIMAAQLQGQPQGIEQMAQQPNSQPIEDTQNQPMPQQGMFACGGHKYDNGGYYYNNNGTWTKIDLADGQTIDDWVKLNPTYSLQGTDDQGRMLYNINTPPKDAPTWMKWAAPSAQLALGITDALGWTNRPNLKGTEDIIKAAEKYTNYIPVKAETIGGYQVFNPMDINYLARQQMAQNASTRRAITGQSTGNRGAALSSLMLNDYNEQTNLGALYRQALDYNNEQRLKVAEFNKGINTFNAESINNANQFNSSAKATADQLGLSAAIEAAKLKDAAIAVAEKNKSDNISGLFTSLNNMYTTNVNSNLINKNAYMQGYLNNWAPASWGDETSNKTNGKKTK